MSQHTISPATTEPSAVPPEADTGSAVIIAVTAPAQAAWGKRRKAVATEAVVAEPARDRKWGDRRTDRAPGQ